MPLRPFCAVFLALIVVSCSNPASDLSIVSKTLKRDVNVSTAGGIGDVPSTATLFWVEGRVQNGGTEEIRNVTISFRVTDGRSKLVLTADVPAVPPGKGVDFRTPAQLSATELHLTDDEPEITVGK